MRHCLLTGASGFFGSHLLRHILVNTAWRVTCVASWQHKGTPERIELAMAGLDANRVRVITHDLSAPFTETTKKRIGHVDTILNVASNSHVDRSIDDPVPFVQGNVNLALSVLEFARETKPSLVLMFSTDEVYGPAPIGVNHAEWSAIVPSNPYSASKAAQEAIAVSYWRTYNVPVVITNTMNLFGETQDAEKYIAQLIRKVYRGDSVTVHGTPQRIGSRYYLHARNAADAVLFIANNLQPVKYHEGTTELPDRYNIVGDVELDNLQLAKRVAEIMGRPLAYDFVDFHAARSGHDRRYALDGRKLAGLGWKAPLDFGQSLTRTIHWTLEHREWL